MGFGAHAFHFTADKASEDYAPHALERSLIQAADHMKVSRLFGGNKVCRALALEVRPL